MRTSDERINAEVAEGVLTLTLDRPDKLNALDASMTAALFQAVTDAMHDAEVRVVRIRGNGRAFTAGADISPSSGRPSPSETDGFGQPQTISNAVSDLFKNRNRVADWMTLRSAPKPLIAQVHGYCLGVGNEIAGCCDIVVCSDDAAFGMPEVREFALPPTLGFWPMRIGLAATKELLFTGRLVNGAEAVRLGLAEIVVPRAELDATALNLANKIAEVPAARLAIVKRAVNAWSDAWGVAAATASGADYHAVYHQVSEFSERFEAPK